MEELQIIENKIYEIRGQKVMLDRDLASLYQVETKVLNQTFKRNSKRFPTDFAFQITYQELTNLKSQIVTSSWGGNRKLPYAFTEQGVAMLSGLLNSDVAIKANIAIMRAFVSMRNRIAEQLDDFDRRIQQLERQNSGSYVADQIPEKLSKEATLKMYSRRAIVIFTRNKIDHALLKFLGARFNPWLTYEGQHVMGWIYPISRMDTLVKYLPLKLSEREKE